MRTSSGCPLPFLAGEALMAIEEGSQNRRKKEEEGKRKMDWD
jgi:hypothetical protein